MNFFCMCVCVSVYLNVSIYRVFYLILLSLLLWLACFVCFLRREKSAWSRVYVKMGRIREKVGGGETMIRINFIEKIFQYKNKKMK